MWKCGHLVRALVLMVLAAAHAHAEAIKLEITSREPIAGGYEVAWKAGADQYSVWTTDSAGNMLANPTGVVSGSSAALQSYEPSFHQDLNGDGTIGAASTTNPALLANAMASGFTAPAGQATAAAPPPPPDPEFLATPMTAK